VPLGNFSSRLFVNSDVYFHGFVLKLRKGFSFNYKIHRRVWLAALKWYASNLHDRPACRIAGAQARWLASTERVARRTLQRIVS